MNKKILIGSIIAVVVIVLSSFSSVVAIDTPMNRGRGETLYVGGTGEGNYTTIQSAIDDAFDGDTVFVYNGTYYEKNIDISKSINLIGEDRTTTFIDGIEGFGALLILQAEEINISNFTLQNADLGVDIPSTCLNFVISNRN